MGIFYAGEQKILPVVQNTENLEYELSSGIKKVTADSTKTIGFLSGHGEFELQQGQSNTGASGSISTAANFLRENYDVIQVTADKEITGVDTLIIAGPTQLFDEKSLYEIDQFIMNGGKVIFLVDKFEVQPSLQAKERPLNLDSFLKNYGVSINNSFIFDRSNEMANFSKGHFSVIQPYPFWPKLTKKYLNKDNPITAKLEAISMLWASPISIDENKEHFSYEVLATSTERSGEIVAENNVYNLDPSQSFAIKADATRQKAIVMVKGKFTSMFAHKSPSEIGIKPPAEALDSEVSTSISLTPETEADANRETKKEALEDSHIIVIGDADFLADGFVQRFKHNIGFFLNAVDYLTLDEDLINIRSKSVTDRPISELSNSEKFIFKSIGVFLMTILVIIYGVSKAYLRRKKKNKYNI